MPRPPTIWWHTQRKYFCVKINGSQVRLSADKEEAQRQFHKLMAEKGATQPAAVNPLLACEVCDRFLVW